MGAMQKMKQLKALSKRLREPSTMAGLAAIAALFGVPGLEQAVGQLIGGAVALAAIFMPEKGQQ